MKVLLLDYCYDSYRIGVVNTSDEFTTLGNLLVNIEYAPLNALEDWLKNDKGKVFEDKCFYSMHKKENLVTMVPYFSQERIEVKPLIISISDLQKVI